jgi:hypothetical protein
MRAFVDTNVNAVQNTDFGTFQVPMLAGEFSLFGLGEAWEYGLGRFTQSGWSWTIWTYKLIHNEGSSWGLYNLRNGESAATNTPSIENDSFETILQKWSSWNSEEHFVRNDWLCDIVRAAAGTQVRPTVVPE